MRAKVKEGKKKKVITHTGFTRVVKGKKATFYPVDVAIWPSIIRMKCETPLAFLCDRCV